MEYYNNWVWGRGQNKYSIQMHNQIISLKELVHYMNLSWDKYFSSYQAQPADQREGGYTYTAYNNNNNKTCFFLSHTASRPKGGWLHLHLTTSTHILVVLLNFLLQDFDLFHYVNILFVHPISSHET